MTFSKSIVLLCALFTLDSAAVCGAETRLVAGDSGVKKIKDLVIYKDDTFYSSFPSVVRRPDGELLVAFRRAPDRRRLGETHISHTDPNSYLELVRSRDSGETWSASPELLFANPFGGAQDPCMVQLSDGSISSDKGKTWNYSCPVAGDGKVAFNETSLYETPKGVLVAFMRTDHFNDHTAVARSTDGGKSFAPWQDAGFMGHPHYALRLPDERVLLVYGYRHAPFGVRARVLDPECTNFNAAEIVLRDDGGSGDLGYPWAAMLSKRRALVVYYFNQNDAGPRYIAGTLLEIK